MIIGRDIGLQFRERRLIFIQEELHQDVVGAILAVEDHLDICRHGDHLVDGNGLVQVLHIRSGAHRFLEAQHIDHGHNGAVVAETERDGGLAVTDYPVGNAYYGIPHLHLTLVVGFGSRDYAAIMNPVGIVIVPDVEQFVFGENVQQGQLQLGNVLEVFRHVVQAFHQFRTVHKAFRLPDICKEQLHQAGRIESLFMHAADTVGYPLIPGRVFHFHVVVLHHKPHVSPTGVHPYVQRRIQPLELLAEVEHAHHAPADCR